MVELKSRRSCFESLKSDVESLRPTRLNCSIDVESLGRDLDSLEADLNDCVQDLSEANDVSFIAFVVGWWSL